MTTEYITVNDNEDLWLIDFDECIAELCTSETIEDLEVNEKEYTEYNNDITSYLEGIGYEVKESNEEKIIFGARYSD